MLLFMCLIIVGIVDISRENPCDAKTCEYGKSCTSNAENPGVCQCMQGYHGENCSDTNECRIGKVDPCGHRGECINTVGSYWCHCLNGWNGTHCRNKITDNAECMPGYSGTYCKVSACDHGYPVNDTGGFRCYCDTGWTHVHISDKCSTDIDECATNTTLCQNGGTCRNTNGSYHCDCVKPWGGKDCAYYNLCSLHPCEHGGNCRMINQSYVCECTSGWHGYNCSDDVDECSEELASSTCFHGNCTNYPGSYNCSCLDDLLGFNCNESVLSSSFTFPSIESTESTTHDPPDTSREQVTVSSEADVTRSPGYHPSTEIVTNGGHSAASRAKHISITTNLADETSSSGYNPSSDTVTNGARQEKSHTYQLSTEASTADDSSLPSSQIIGVTVGALAAVILCCLAGYFLFKRKLSKVSATGITDELPSQ